MAKIIQDHFMVFGSPRNLPSEFVFMVPFISFSFVPFGIFGACRFLLVAFLAMAAIATASSAGPRYAPPDPTLPKPWKGLVDGKTGYLYFWNPVTNVTQYERPTSVDSVPKSSSVPISSFVPVQQSSEGRRAYGPDKENNQYGRGSNAVSKLESVSRSSQVLFYFCPLNQALVGSGFSSQSYLKNSRFFLT